MQRYPHSTGTITGYYLTLALINSCSSKCFSLPWENIVWIAGGIAKHSFLCWLFIVDRCPTRDRLLRWGLQTAPSCLLCNSAAESRDHLFFLCPYSWNLWSRLGRRCDLIPEQQWGDVTTQLQSFNSRNWQSCIYWTWQERNSRLHRNTFRSTDGLLRLIDRQIRDRILSYRERACLRFYRPSS